MLGLRRARRKPALVSEGTNTALNDVEGLASSATAQEERFVTTQDTHSFSNKTAVHQGDRHDTVSMLALIAIRHRMTR